MQFCRKAREGERGQGEEIQREGKTNRRTDSKMEQGKEIRKKVEGETDEKRKK